MLTRRVFLGALATLAIPVPRRHWPSPLWRARSQVELAALRIDATRLRHTLESLSQFGRPANGSFADGVSRLAYSDADVQGRAYVLDLIKSVGLSPRLDPAGNILARRDGADASLPPIVFGSHIDSVPNGGNFDGDLGSLSAIEAVRLLNERKIATRHPLEVVVWANEEGVAFNNGLCGSRAVAGKLPPEELEHVYNGVKKTDAIRKIGGDPTRIPDARRSPGSFHCYVELHIEQGGTLEKTGIPIGVVEGIVAIDRYDAVIRGMANHAGTTPMPDRHDALIAAAQLTLAVREIVTSEPGRQVGTVGHLEVVPNAPNVIPGVVRHTIELRDLSASKLERLAQAVRDRARQIAAATGTTIDLTLASHHEAATASPVVQDAIEAAADHLRLAHQRLPSGAGHDAQSMAQLGPMAMIFVPSIGGISHSPRELTSWDDCARGANTLLHAVLAADRMDVRS
ncbi:MAG: Zn-dependent hydrolase [Acidobacteria bacterium]|nr:Zn-dependent hydrolase [Acidobacteriota bacterium]